MKIAQDTSPQAADPLQIFVSSVTATIHQPGLRGGGGGGGGGYFRSVTTLKIYDKYIYLSFSCQKVTLSVRK